jgi:hypothetical protein
MSFNARDRQRLRQTLEVQIETPGRRSGRRTTIWVVTTDEGAFIRSFRGPHGLWYREALARGEVVIHAGRGQIQVRLIPERNSRTVREVTLAYRRKYGKRWPQETAAMLKPNVARTTLRLEPPSRRAGDESR